MPDRAPLWLGDYARVLDGLVTSGCVVTTRSDGRDAGSFVTSVMACNLRTVRFIVATWQGSLTDELIARSGVLVLHVLGAEHAPLVDTFGKQAGRQVDKFANVAYRRGVTGAPVLADCLGYVEGRAVCAMDCGDHTARLVEPVAAGWKAPGCDRSFLTTDIRRLGLEPPFADDPHRLR